MDNAELVCCGGRNGEEGDGEWKEFGRSDLWGKCWSTQTGGIQIYEYNYNYKYKFPNTFRQKLVNRIWKNTNLCVRIFAFFVIYRRNALNCVLHIYVLSIWYFGSACLVFCISMQRCLVTLMDFRSRLSGDSLSVARHLQLQSCPSAFSSFLLPG